MKPWKKASICIMLFIMFCFISIGYAAVTDTIGISGSASIKPAQYDIYITKITPESLGSITINNYYYTIVSSSVDGASQPTFTITVKNQSDKIYVFERIVEGSETGFEGIYGGEGVTYTLDGLTFLQEVGPGQELTFRVTIKADSTVHTDELLTFF